MFRGRLRFDVEPAGREAVRLEGLEAGKQKAWRPEGLRRQRWLL